MVTENDANKDLPYYLTVAVRRVLAPVCVVVALLFSMYINNVRVIDAYYALMIIAALLALMLYPGERRSHDILSSKVWNISLSVLGRWGLMIGVLLLLGYATKTSSVFSRMALFTWFLITPPLLVLAQVGVEILASRFLLLEGRKRRVVIAGADELGHKLAEKIKASPLSRMRIAGFFDDRGQDRLSNGTSIPLLGKLKDLPAYIRSNDIDVAFIALPIKNVQRVTDLLDQLHDTTVSIYFVPDVFVFDLIQCRTSDIDGLPIVALCETPFQGAPGVVKVLSDYVIASIVVLLTSPIMIAIAIAIKLTSPGSVIFKQRRYGLDGREIIVYKFRSMTVSEDEDVVKQATRDDERVTRVGAFLRKYSLDELPQFLNVLQGRMSIVGPRPHAVAHNEEYRPLIKGYMMRHKVNPGITGLAQVLGYRGETSSIEAMEKRVEYDLEYLRNWSLSLDLQIIFRTIRVMLNDKMAY
ncbi:MAG: undecaprenyl-phosphate glucose phosphotransferase [Proteobacteria bacterium]|nr:undecaprenyl-phosphate glucose phosphotransferase [Pseudomonadota bacterium]